MDLVRHLEYFAAIAHERHFGRAAQRLGIRQPPLSQGLKRLETDLGVRLCDRDSQGVVLTDAGQALLPAVHRVLDEVEQLKLLARRQEAPARTRVRMRIPPGLGTRHFALLVAACRRSVPDAEVDATEQSTVDQLADLGNGRADIGILREPVAARGLTLGPQVRVPLNGVLPADHPAAGQDRVRVRDLAGYALVLPPREQAPAAYEDLVAACERHGFLPEAIDDVADDRHTLGLVASGAHVAFTTDGPGGGDGTVVLPFEDEPLGMVLRPAWLGVLSHPFDQLPGAIVAALVRPMGAGGAAASADRWPRPASGLPVTSGPTTGSTSTASSHSRRSAP